MTAILGFPPEARAITSGLATGNRGAHRLSRRSVIGGIAAAALSARTSFAAVRPSGSRTLKNMLGAAPTVDIHVHLVPPAWFGAGGQPAARPSREEFATQLSRTPYLPVPDAAALVEHDYDRLLRFEAARADGTIETTTAFLISEMDAAGIDIAVNQCMDEVNQPFGRRYTVPIEKVLEDIARMAALYPGRIVNFFGIDPRRGKEGLGLLRRAVEQFGVCGMGEWLTLRWPISPADRQLAYPYFELCTELGIPYGNNGSGLAVSQMPEVFEQVLRDFPTLKIVNQASGLLTDRERSDHPDEIDLPYRLLELAERHDNFWLDIDDWERLDDAGKTRTFRFLRRAFDGPAAGRVMFGTDFPVFTKAVSAATFVGSLINDGSRLGVTLSKSELRRLFSTNALAFLNGPQAPAFIKAAARGR